jgi:hypothetical protein
MPDDNREAAVAGLVGAVTAVRIGLFWLLAVAVDAGDGGHLRGVRRGEAVEPGD